MAKAKTTATVSSVTDFINAVPEEQKKKSSFELIDLLKKETGFEPKMWGPAIVGFGSYHYKYASGHEGDAPLVGFSPRKDAIALYLSSDFDKKEELLGQFGKHKAGKGCIYIKKLEDVKVDVLKKMIHASIKRLGELYPNK